MPSKPDAGLGPQWPESTDSAATIRIVSGDQTFTCVNRTTAAKHLGISLRTLHSRTYPHGPIHPIRWGRRVLYSVNELNRYLTDAMKPSGTTDRTGGDQ